MSLEVFRIAERQNLLQLLTRHLTIQHPHQPDFRGDFLGIFQVDSPPDWPRRSQFLLIHETYHCFEDRSWVYGKNTDTSNAKIVYTSYAPSLWQQVYDSPGGGVRDSTRSYERQETCT